MKRTPEIESKAVALYRDGEPLRAIGKRLGISHELARRIVKAAGVDKGPRKSVEDRMREIAHSVVLEHLAHLPRRAA